MHVFGNRGRWSSYKHVIYPRCHCVAASGHIAIQASSQSRSIDGRTSTTRYTSGLQGHILDTTLKVSHNGSAIAMGKS